MPLETGDFIPELDPNNPLGSDNVSLGDDHIRLLKRCTQGSFPAFVGTAGVPKSVAFTEDEINNLPQRTVAEIITGAWDFQAGSGGLTISSTGGVAGLKQSHPGGNDFLSEWTATLNWIMSGLTSVTTSGAWTFPGNVTFDASQQINATMFWNTAPRLANNIGLNSIDVGAAANINLMKLTSVDTMQIGQGSIIAAIEFLTNTLFHSCDTYADAAVFSRFTTDGPTGQGLRIISDSSTTKLRGFSDPSNAKTVVIDSATNEALDAPTGGGLEIALQLNSISKARIVDHSIGSILLLDGTNVFKKAGFRNPSRSFHTADFALLQNREGQWVEFSGTGPFTCTVNSLEEFTTMTVSNISSNDLLIAEGTAGLQWYDGAGAGAQTGDRTLSPGSVCELYWRSATFVAIYGNGLS